MFQTHLARPTALSQLAKPTSYGEDSTSNFASGLALPSALRAVYAFSSDNAGAIPTSDNFAFLRLPTNFASLTTSYNNAVLDALKKLQKSCDARTSGDMRLCFEGVDTILQSSSIQQVINYYNDSVDKKHFYMHSPADRIAIYLAPSLCNSKMIERASWNFIRTFSPVNDIIRVIAGASEISKINPSDVLTTSLKLTATIAPLTSDNTISRESSTHQAEIYLSTDSSIKQVIINALGHSLQRADDGNWYFLYTQPTTFNQIALAPFRVNTFHSKWLDDLVPALKNYSAS